MLSQSTPISIASSPIVSILQIDVEKVAEVRKMNAIVVRGLTVCISSAKLIRESRNHAFNSKFLSSRTALKCNCVKKEKTQNSFEEFSVLKSDIPCDSGSLWSGMALYVFSFHVPLSFGGLSAISNILHRPVLDPETEAISLLVIQTLELIGVLLLLRFPMKPQSSILEFFQAKQVSKERNWLLASAIGFGLLVFLVFLTSFISYRLVGPKDVNNPIVKEILSSSSISLTACILVYCVVTPFLEEIVYRRFFLTALSSTMKWQQAVIISSMVFSAVHFSAENFIPLFIIGSILGGSYCWSGNLCSSVVIHSLYNALTLLITYMS
ncbi:uncharacterized protein LOC116016829 isoform X2 [Ipomoea triloba]|uniref:uncharacterized protein LOC116016829 isoform X2 n=1 Tax=Ipomoea triloba TaxID=35885 RepID=UPI00125E5384|nr:uncharacterized protein LOC116016829 isoform X2 [Ipomoea triloba]